MSKIFKVVSVLMCMALFVTITPSIKSKANSAIEVPFIPATDSRIVKTNFDFDLTLFRRYEALRKTDSIKVGCFLGGTSGIGKNDIMGYFVVRTAAYVPEFISDDGTYHTFIVYECEMEPGIMNSKYHIRSRANKAMVGFAPENYALTSTIQTPTAEILQVSKEKSDTTTKTQNFSISVSGKLSKGNSSSGKSSGSEISGSVGYSNGRTTQIGMKISYQTNGFYLRTSKANGCASWEYVYNYYGDDQADSWSQTDTYTSGILEYRTSSNGSMTGKKVKCKINIAMGAQFFEGKKSGEKILNNNKYEDLGWLEETFDFSY